MHGVVEAAVPHGGDGQPKGRTLWRVDPSRGDGATRLYIVSAGEPDVSVITRQAGFVDGTRDAARDYEPLLGSLSTGQSWHFRLTANPTRMDPVTRQRLGLLSEEGQVAWVMSHGRTHGYAIPSDSLGPMVVIASRELRHFQHKGATATIEVVTYDGVLEVTDPVLLRSALCNGVGRAKAFGCGLLTLSRAA